MSLTCLMIIKDGIKNGYPFLESIRSIVDSADEFLISDGHSEDGTYDYLELVAQKFKNVELFRDHWSKSDYGEIIATMTNRLKERAKCDWVYNLQADEVIHEAFLPKLRLMTSQPHSEYASFALKFLHFVGDFQHVETKPGYEHAVRLVPNLVENFVAEDGWTFGGSIDPVGLVEDPPLFHFGWVYSKNNLYKRKNQAKNIHSQQKSYQKDYDLCLDIENEYYDSPDKFAGWQRKMLAYRKIRKYEGDYPLVAKGLLQKGTVTYDPDPGVLDMDFPVVN